MFTVQCVDAVEYPSLIDISLYKSLRHIGAFDMGVVVSFRLQAIFLAFFPLILRTDYGHITAKSLILCSPNSYHNPKYIFLENILKV